MTYTSIFQQKENIEIIDLTMDSSDDEYCCSSSAPSSYMELDEIIEECSNVVDLVDEEYEDEQNFFDEGVTEGDLEKGHYYFDVDNGFYKYNEHYSNNDGERFVCYRDDDGEENFFEREPENVGESYEEDLLYTDDFSILATNSHNNFELQGSTLVELD